MKTFTRRDGFTGANTTLRVGNGQMEVCNHDTPRKFVKTVVDKNQAVSGIKQKSNLRHVASVPAQMMQELNWEYRGMLPSQRRNASRPCDSFTFEEFINMKLLNNSDYKYLRTWQGSL